MRGSILFAYSSLFVLFHTGVTAFWCDSGFAVNGSWTGFFPPATESDTDEYYIEVINENEATNTITFNAIPSLANGWEFGVGTIYENGSVLLLLDGGSLYANGGDLTGMINHNCSKIEWDNQSVWERQLPITKKVHVVWMSHLDVGYDGINPVVGYINNVLNVYIQNHLPRGVFISKAMRKLGYKQGFIFTQHPW